MLCNLGKTLTSSNICQEKLIIFFISARCEEPHFKGTNFIVLKLLAYNVCKMFVYRHTETIEYVKK